MKVVEDNVDSSAVIKKLEEELLKRDALIEVYYVSYTFFECLKERIIHFKFFYNFLS